MEPFYVQLQLLKELYGAAGEQDLRDPSHPIWRTYDSFHALTGNQGFLNRTSV